jgi:hypothetical protein
MLSARARPFYPRTVPRGAGSDDASPVACCEANVQIRLLRTPAINEKPIQSVQRQADATTHRIVDKCFAPRIISPRSETFPSSPPAHGVLVICVFFYTVRIRRLACSLLACWPRARTPFGRIIGPACAPCSHRAIPSSAATAPSFAHEPRLFFASVIDDPKPVAFLSCEPRS